MNTQANQQLQIFIIKYKDGKEKQKQKQQQSRRIFQIFICR